MISVHGILYVEPSANVAVTPIIDTLTRKMTGALRRATPGAWTPPDPVLGGRGSFRARDGYRGHHTCQCGARSSGQDYWLAAGLPTNSLCVHYLAWHRHEIPAQQMELLQRVLRYELEAMPLEQELQPPGR